MTMELAAKEIVSKLKHAGHEAVFAGGCVRDFLLALPAKDIDIATSATPDEVEALFKRTVPVGKQFGIIVVLHKDFEFEVATFRTDSKESDGRRPDSVEFSSMEEDAKRRDLTINGLFWDPIKGELFDFVEGKVDIDLGLIRFIGNAQDRIDEDKLRMLRAVRFTAKLGFDMECEVLDVIRKNAHLITGVSAERIKDEMDKMLKTDKPSVALNLLRESGLLKHFLPAVDKLWGTKQSAHWHSEGDVWVHTMLVLDNTRKQTDSLVALWAALLHDVGKPGTAGFNSKGDINNHGHDKLGAELALEIMSELRTSSKEKEAVVAVVSDHMKAHAAKDMRKSKLRRFVAQDHFEDLLFVVKADCESSIPLNPEADDRKGDSTVFLREFVDTLEDGVELPAPFVTGKDLISFGLKPGPMFRELLDKVSERQLEGDVSDRNEALEFVKSLL